MQKFSNFQKLFNKSNFSNINKYLINNNLNKSTNNNPFIYTSSKNFAFKNNKTMGISTIDQIGKEYKVSKDRVKSSIKPKTLSEIKKIKDFIKTTNDKGDLEE